jgi:hypothetical protein
MSTDTEATVNTQLLDCKVYLGEQAQTQPLTVGDPFKIDCSADSFTLNPSQLKFVTPRPYQLQILKTEMQPDGRLQILVTSYQVGAFNSTDLVLTDGVSQVKVQGVEFQVKSVIDQNNPPKGPFGPFGGHTLNLPPLYLWSAILLVILVLLGVIVKSFRRWQRKKMLEGLKKHDSRLGPQTQLHVRFRQLERQRFVEGGEIQKHLAEVEDILRLFVIRQFKIPAYDWSDRLILNDFQKRFAFLGADMAKELTVLLRETRKARSMEKPSTKDIEQLVRKIKRWADQVDRVSKVGHSLRGVSL